MAVCGGGEGVNAVEIGWLDGSSVLRSKSVDSPNGLELEPATYTPEALADQYLHGS